MKNASLPEEDRRKLEKIVNEIGEVTASLRLGLPRSTLVRALAPAIKVRPGTVLLVRQALDDYDKQSRRRATSK